MNNGYIQLHRKLLDNPIMANPELLQIFVYCLLKANHEPNEFIWNNTLIQINRGQFITGLLVMAKDLKQKQTSLYRRLKLLEQLQYISLKSENKFTLLTICNYSTYQAGKKENGKQTENKRKTNGKQVETNNNDNKDNNDNKSKFDILFDTWFEYKKARKESYKNQPAIDKFKTHLLNLSNNDPDIAERIIDKSMANNWAGIFALGKNDKLVKNETLHELINEDGKFLVNDKNEIIKQL